jgi:hypothetical protein
MSRASAGSSAHDNIANDAIVDCNFEMPSSGNRTIPRERLFVIAAMRLNHFPTMDDPCIRTGNKANTLGEKNGRKN